MDVFLKMTTNDILKKLFLLEKDISNLNNFRCECHGHAATCEHANLPYQCNCLPESHTQGRQVRNKNYPFSCNILPFYQSFSDGDDGG